MAVMIDLTLFIASCIGLVIFGALLVKSLSRLAAFLRMSEFIVAFAIMALATSLPELFVAINASIMKNSALVIGNVIGSNIANLTLIAGIAIILGRGISTKSKLIKKDAYWMVFICVLAVILMFLGRTLSRLDGIILLAVFIFYFIYMLKTRKGYQHKFKNHVTRWQGIGWFVLFVLALPLLYFASTQVVVFAKALSAGLALPLIFIGLFFVALGTSLPELAVEVAAVRTGHSDMALGNLIGSVVMNSTLVLGIAALISPITSNFFLFLTSSIFMIVICTIFAVFLETKGKLHWKEGIVLLMMYILFLIVELNLKNFYLMNGMI